MSPYAEGMMDISRRSSVATPPDIIAKPIASQRDARATKCSVSARKERPFAGIPRGMRAFLGKMSGGVAPLEHR